MIKVVSSLQVGWLVVVGIGALLVAWLLRGRDGKKTGRPQVISAVEDFTERMEEENERLIEMISLLRQKLDQQELEQDHAGAYLREQSAVIAERVRQVESRLDKLLLAPSSEGPVLPEYLSPRYRAAAERLLAGDMPLTIMRDMNMGQGEIDLIARLLESESEEA